MFSSKIRFDCESGNPERIDSFFVRISMPNRHFKPALAILVLALGLAGCSSTAPRDRHGEPHVQRLSASDSIAPRAEKIGVGDVAAMARRGDSPDQIVAQMRNTGSRLSMDASQQSRLRELGVSTPIIDALVDAERSARRTDRITKEVDREAKERERARRAAEIWSSPYDYYPSPYWGAPRTYRGFGIGSRGYRGAYGGWGW